MTYESEREQETFSLGFKMGSCAKAGDVYCLTGDLGAGKTAFVRGFSSVLSSGSRVKSPTYNIVNEYRQGATPLYHFDLYRLEDSEDGLDSIGFDHYVQSGHCILEWSEFLDTRPAGAVTVKITKAGDDKRIIEITL